MVITGNRASYSMRCDAMSRYRDGDVSTVSIYVDVDIEVNGWCAMCDECVWYWKVKVISTMISKAPVLPAYCDYIRKWTVCESKNYCFRAKFEENRLVVAVAFFLLFEVNSELPLSIISRATDFSWAFRSSVRLYFHDVAHFLLRPNVFHWRLMINLSVESSIDEKKESTKAPTSTLACITRWTQFILLYRHSFG